MHIITMIIGVTYRGTHSHSGCQFSNLPSPRVSLCYNHMNVISSSCPSVQVCLFRCVCSGVSVQVCLFRCVCSGVSVKVGVFRWVCSGGSVQVGLCRWVCSAASVEVCLTRCTYSGTASKRERIRNVRLAIHLTIDTMEVIYTANSS